ncbi:MAG: hypothetical protein JKY50_09530 [Oleispira sp.]|nr:hypothetical protein [Oleispira sp.]
MSDQKAPPLEKVVLLKAHTHAGEKYDAKAELSVSPTVKTWLIENKIAEAKPATANKKDVK